MANYSIVSKNVTGLLAVIRVTTERTSSDKLQTLWTYKYNVNLKNKQWADNSKTNRARVFILVHDTHFDKRSSLVTFH